MAKFTPGPWDWDQPSNWHGISARVMKREPYGMIAQVDISGWRPKSMAIANARLIAAAPEMHAGLESAYQLLARLGESGDLSVIDTAAVLSEAIRIREILSKAVT